MTKPEPFIMDAGGAEKRHAPATIRNRDAIADVLERVLPSSGTVLEVASGTGEHIVHFAQRFPQLVWQPSDYSDLSLPSIAAWVAEAGVSNIRPAVQLDASAGIWPLPSADAILCINMIHISPWAATEGLMAGAGRLLPAGAPLYLYGPFLRDGVETAPSNLDFDRSLKERDVRWGLRNLSAVTDCAQANGLTLADVLEMPANNLSVVFRKG
jgi:Protein of unknown function (DUF938)